VIALKDENFKYRTMKKLLFLIPLILIGCKAQQPISVPLHDSTSISSTETITEDPTWTVPAEAYWKMVFECDSNLNVLLVDYEAAVSGMEENIRIEREKSIKAKNEQDGTQSNLAKQQDHNRRLIVDISVYVDSIEIQNKTIEKLRKEISTFEIPLPVNVPVKYVPKYHKFTAWAFPVLLILVGLCVYLSIRLKLLKRA